MQQSHPADSQPEPKETDEQAGPAQGTIVEVGQADFEQEVIQADMPVVIDFWADWCRPCHMIRPTLEQLAEEFAGKVKFVGVNTEANTKLARKFQVIYLPTIVIINDGEEIDRA
ncbi:MAG: redoxin domain-containing protein, partial [Armatimonadetes bacterium]|nr:redoxin domain-containing protein [Armatimonadota bacterium]